MIKRICIRNENWKVNIKLITYMYQLTFMSIVSKIYKCTVGPYFKILYLKFVSLVNLQIITILIKFSVIYVILIKCYTSRKIIY
jgi:hypothetical protein